LKDQPIRHHTRLIWGFRFKVAVKFPIRTPLFFFCNSILISAGLKSSGQKDVALVVNQGPKFEASAVFTSNKIKAAPVIWTQEIIKNKKLKAVVMNSGGANACTGPAGFEDTRHALFDRVSHPKNKGEELMKYFNDKFGVGRIAIR